MGDRKEEKNLFNLCLFEKLLMCCFIIGFLVTSFFIFTGAHTFFNSDTATANLLAREQIETGQFFPRGWYYVQDIWTFFINIFIIPLSIFIKNQLMLRSCAVFLQTIFLVMLLIVFSRKIFKNNSWILYCAILFTGMSNSYLENMFGQAAYGYVVIWILLLTMFGLFTIDKNLKLQKKELFIFSLLLFVSSIGGVRYVGIFLAPFLLAVCLVYYIDNQNLSTKDNICHLLNFIKWLFIVLIATLAGLMVFWYIAKTFGYIAGSANPIIYSGGEYEKILDGINTILPSLWVLMGFDTSVSLLSLSGIFSIVKMVATIAFVFVFPILLTTKYKTLSLSVKRFVFFCWFSFIITSILFILVPNMGALDSARYFQVTVVLQLLNSCYYIYNYLLKKNYLTTLISMFAIIVFICGSLFGMLKATQNEKEALRPNYDLIEVLRQKGLKFGYAEYWDAYRLSVFGDFKPEIVAIVGDPISPMYHLSSSRWYTDKYYNGKTFLMLNDDGYKRVVLEGKAEKQFGKEEEIFQHGGYYFLVYNYNISSKFANKYIQEGEKTGLINDMLYNEFVEVNDDASLNAKRNGIIYGPYISLQNGNYKLRIECNYKGAENKPFLIITANSGNEIIKQVELKNDIQTIDVSIDKYTENVEFKIVNDSWDSILLKEVSIEMFE